MGASVYSNPEEVADLNVLGPDPDADEPRRNAAQPRHSIQEPNDEWRPHRRLAAEHAADDATLNEELHRLRHTCRQLASALHVVEIARVHAALAQGKGQTVGGGDRVLDRQVD